MYSGSLWIPCLAAYADPVSINTPLVGYDRRNGDYLSFRRIGKEAQVKSQSFFSAATLMVLMAVSGCSVALKPQPFTAPVQTYSDQIAVSRRAEGIDGKVGWGRFTVFYIPLIPIYIEGGDGNEQVMQQVGIALQQAGYKVSVVDGADPSLPAPLLKCKIEKFWFNNYTWFFPIVPTWGEVRLTLNLFSRDGGKLLWSHSFSGDASTFNFTDGYSIAANKSMKIIVDDMVREFANADFLRALRQG
jgi:hypothetical protein